MNVVNILLGVFLGIGAASLMTSFYLYLIYVIPFISRLDRQHLLKKGHNLKRYVLLGGAISFGLGILIIVLTLVFANGMVEKWLTLTIITVLVVFLVDTHVLDRFGKGNKRIQTILNFKEPIVKSLKDAGSASSVVEQLVGVESSAVINDRHS